MKKIFISRALKSDSIFRRDLESEGFEVFAESLLDFELVPFEKIPAVDWIFFYSQKGVQFFFNHIFKNNIPFSKKIKFAGFGEKTAEAIESFNVSCNFVGTGKAASTAPDFLNIAKGKKVLFPRAKNSQRSVQLLIDKKIQTKDLVIYKNFPKENFEIPRMDYLVFTSPLNAQVFFKKYKFEQGQKVFSIGKTTANTLIKLGIHKVIFPRVPSEKNLTQLVLNYV